MQNSELVREKIDQAAAILDEFDIDMWLTFVRESTLQPDPALELIYDGDVTWQSAFMICRDGEHIAIAGHFDLDNIRNLDVYPIVIGYHEDVGKHIREQLALKQPRSIAINFSEDDVAADGLSVGMLRNLRRYLSETPYVDRLVSAENIIAALRGRKSPSEVARVRHAVGITEKIFDEVEKFVKPGMTQREISSYVHGLIDSQGLDYAWPKPFNPIVTCGPQSAIGHAAPGDVVLEKGHTLHLDLGIKANDYCSDIQRMWYVLDDGEAEAPPDVKQAFDVVLGAIRAGEEALKPDVPGWQVDLAARNYITDHGYPEYMHAFGHLLGRVAHDGATVLGPRWERYRGICERVVETDNIFTLELHVVVPGRGIMSLEEDVLVKEDGVEYLSDPQTELRYIQT